MQTESVNREQRTEYLLAAAAVVIILIMNRLLLLTLALNIG